MRKTCRKGYKEGRKATEWADERERLRKVIKRGEGVWGKMKMAKIRK